MKLLKTITLCALSFLALGSTALRAEDKGELKTARQGDKVTLTWKLAAPTTYQEVVRNDKETPAGRTRVKIVKTDVVEFVDTVPNADADYWYWIKYKNPEGKLENLGPVKAPAKEEAPKAAPAKKGKK